MVSDQGGRPAIFVDSSIGLMLQRVTVYASSLVAIALNNVRSTSVEGVVVEPRPGTPRVVSSNADGLGFQQAGEQNRVRDSSIRRPQDDGISANTLALALVKEQPAPQAVLVARRLPFGSGIPVYFVDPSTALPVANAVVESQSSLPSGDVEVHLDRPLPGLAAGSAMLDGDPNHRGSGLIIEGNRIEDVLLGRGVSLWGLVDVVVRGNQIRNTQMAGIDPLQRVGATDWICGPNERIEVRENVLERANVGFELITPEMLSAILVHSLNDRQQTVTGRMNRDITIVGNRISDTPRSAIRVENVEGGSIVGNLLESVASAPAAPRSGPFRDPNVAPSLAAEFAQPIVVKNSEVTVADAIVGDSTASGGR